MRLGLITGVVALAVAVPVMAQQAQGQAGRQAKGRQTAAMFQRLDKNHDGVVSKDEWPRGEQAFTRLDANKDGVLTPDEIRRAATPRQMAAQRIRARMVQRQLRRMDVNGDGTISRDEWRGKPEMFDRIDANKDGLLTAAEIRQFRARARGGARLR